jgi:hypothetical protein
MTIQADLRARLTGLAGGRVYWDERPQNTALPAIVISQPSDSRPQTLKDADLPFPRFQVDVLTLSFAEKLSLKEAVIAALSSPAVQGGTQFMRATEVTARTFNERTETQFIFRDAIDFVIPWTTA